MHGEHRALAEKVLPYEESIRVPLVLRGPGVPRGPRSTTGSSANVDVTSTILDETDVAPGRVQDGRSLLELLADPGAEWGRDILIENGNGANGVPTYRGIRNYRFLYVEHRTTGEHELYDLAEGPVRAAEPRRARAVREGPARPPHAAALTGALRGRGLPGPAPPDALGALRRPPRDRLLHEGPARPGARLEARPAAARRRDDRPPPRRAPAQHPDRARPARRPRDPERDREAPADPPRAGRFRLRVLAETEDGRRLTLDRTLRRCVKTVEQPPSGRRRSSGWSARMYSTSARLDATAKSGLRSSSPFNTPSAIQASTRSRISPVRERSSAAAACRPEHDQHGAGHGAPWPVSARKQEPSRPSAPRPARASGSAAPADATMRRAHC